MIKVFTFAFSLSVLFFPFCPRQPNRRTLLFFTSTIHTVQLKRICKTKLSISPIIYTLSSLDYLLKELGVLSFRNMQILMVKSESIFISK